MANNVLSRMKLFRVAIIDDEPSAAETLKSTVSTFMEKHGYPCSIDLFSKPLSFLDSFQCDYDLLFLDIEMPSMDGIALARKIREKDGLVTLIFVTNLAQFALEAYAVQASDYLLKPVSEAAFELKMTRLMRKLAPDAEERFIIRSGGQTMVVSVLTIDYIEANDHHVIYHIGEDAYTTYEKMKDVEKRLPPFFAKCNRYYLVNLLKVSAIQGDTVILAKTKQELRISRNEKKSFLERLSEYFKRREP